MLRHILTIKHFFYHQITLKKINALIKTWYIIININRNKHIYDNYYY